MEEPKLNAVVTLRSEVPPWLMILQVVPDCWTFPDYVPRHVTRLGLLGFGQAGTYGGPIHTPTLDRIADRTDK